MGEEYSDKNNVNVEEQCWDVEDYSVVDFSVEEHDVRNAEEVLMLKITVYEMLRDTILEILRNSVDVEGQ